MIRMNRSWRIAAAATAAGLTLAACGTTEDSGSDDNASGGDDCKGTIAYVGPLTGDYANLGQNMLNGVNLALEQFKEDNADCDITLKESDSQGDPEKATPLVSQLVQDQDVIGVVGPSFSGETEATGATFAEAGLVTVSPSATNPGLSQNGWDTFHRALGNDALRLTGDLSDEQRAALVRIADRCPVHLTLERSSEVVTALATD